MRHRGNYKSPDILDVETGKYGKLDNEEIKTRIQENKLRKEQGVKARVLPRDMSQGGAVVETEKYKK